jgi:hypothetical protein
MDARDYLLISDPFMWSDSADYVIIPTTVTIPPTEKSCLMVYVSLCDTCILKIPKLNHTFTSTTQHNTTNVAKEYVVHSWQSRRLNLFYETTLTFFKEKTTNDTKGYWGIDIRECPQILDDKGNILYSVEMTYGINSVISKLMIFVENAETGQFLFFIMLIVSCFTCS